MVMIFHVMLQDAFDDIRKTTKGTFKFVIGRVTTSVVLHFDDIISGKVTLITFQPLKEKK